MKWETLLKDLKYKGEKDDSKPVSLLLVKKLTKQKKMSTEISGITDMLYFNNFASVYNRANIQIICFLKKAINPY